jgi:HORMA domain
MQAQQTRTEQINPTATQSLVMMRNLLRTAFSAISYTRNLFPEKCFVDRKLAGSLPVAPRAEIPES